MKKDSYQILLRPLVTEKGVAAASEHNQYPFEVREDANKTEIKRAVEEVFNVHVKSVRTMIRRGKPRRVRWHTGLTRSWKRAIVTLAPGETIEFI